MVKLNLSVPHCPPSLPQVPPHLPEVPLTSLGSPSPPQVRHLPHRPVLTHPGRPSALLGRSLSACVQAPVVDTGGSSIFYPTSERTSPTQTGLAQRHHGACLLPGTPRAFRGAPPARWGRQVSADFLELVPQPLRLSQEGPQVRRAEGASGRGLNWPQSPSSQDVNLGTPRGARALGHPLLGWPYDITHARRTARGPPSSPQAELEWASQAGTCGHPGYRDVT